MDITISFFMLVAIVILALMSGFWIGRSVRWMMVETESMIKNGQESDIDVLQEERDDGEPRKGEHQNRKLKNGEKRIPLGWTIGSPVTGTVRSSNNNMGKGAIIYPDQGKLFAPASGKITRLYPMGNTMLLRTDFGVELMLRVGEMQDEMDSMYYRSYVVQNEIVSKGKLLLEFDLDGLRSKGEEIVVSVTVVSAGDWHDVILTRKESVKTGDELLWVR